MKNSFDKIGRYLNGLILPLTNPTHIKPHIVANTVLDIDFQGLKQEGFKYVVFDKDNTLTDHYVNEITDQKIYDKVEQVREIFGGQNVAIFTNNLEVKEVKNCNLNVITGKVKKPKADLTITAYFNTIFTKENSPCNEFFNSSKCILVGDRLLTDMAQAHNMKGLGVWVKPWDLESE